MRTIFILQMTLIFAFMTFGVFAEGMELPKVWLENRFCQVYGCDEFGNVCLCDGKKKPFIARMSKLEKPEREKIRELSKIGAFYADASDRDLAKKYIIASSLPYKADMEVVAIGKECFILR